MRPPRTHPRRENNVEQVSLSNLPPGPVAISVGAANVFGPAGPQSYALVVHGDFRCVQGAGCRARCWLWLARVHLTGRVGSPTPWWRAATSGGLGGGEGWLGGSERGGWVALQAPEDARPTICHALRPRPPPPQLAPIHLPAHRSGELIKPGEPGSGEACTITVAGEAARASVQDGRRCRCRCRCRRRRRCCRHTGQPARALGACPGPGLGALARRVGPTLRPSPAPAPPPAPAPGSHHGGPAGRHPRLRHQLRVQHRVGQHQRWVDAWAAVRSDGLAGGTPPPSPSLADDC